MNVTANRAIAGNRVARQFKTAYIALLIACALLQVAIEPSLKNIACAALALVSSVVTALYVMRPLAFRAQPIPMVMVLGYNFSTQAGALITQSLTLRALTYNLDLPLATFSLCFVVQAAVIAAHHWYAGLPSMRRLEARVRRAIVEPIGLMDSPSKFHFWIFGLIGSAASWTVGAALRTEVEFGDVGLKFFAGFMPFAAAPFLIPLLPSLFGVKSTMKRGDWIALAGYFLLTLVIALGRNARVTFASALLNLIVGVVIALLIGAFRFRRKDFLVGAAILVAAIPAYMQLSDLAKAMVIARGVRNHLSATGLIRESFATFQDKKALQAYDGSVKSAVGSNSYNEEYIGGVFMSRLVNTKYVDLMIIASRGFSDAQRQEVKVRSVESLYRQLPSPILSVVRPDLDKNQMRYSGGDLYNNLSWGAPFGQYLVGSSIVDAKVLFGYFFLPAIAFIFLLQAFVWNSMTAWRLNGSLMIAPIVVLNCYTIFMQSVNYDSMATILGNLVRGTPQFALMYVIANMIVRVLRSLLRMNRKPPARAFG